MDEVREVKLLGDCPSSSRTVRAGVHVELDFSLPPNDLDDLRMPGVCGLSKPREYKGQQIGNPSDIHPVIIRPLPTCLQGRSVGRTRRLFGGDEFKKSQWK